MIAHRVSRLFIAGLASMALMAGVPRNAAAQDAPSAPAPATSPGTEPATQVAAVGSEVRARLAEKLGLKPADLSDDTDLVRDLGLDQGTVYYAVQDVLDSYGVKPPKKELTRVGDVVAAVTATRSVAAVKKRALAAGPMGTSYVQTVFYVTDRKATGDSAPETFFGAARSENGVLNYGRAEVNIPYSHKTGQIETPWLSIVQLRDPGKHIYVLKLHPGNEGQFFSEVASFGAGEGDVLVYFHGFNVSFDDAIVRAGQIAFDFGFKGAPIVYSWPSWRSMTGYNSDWENVNWSTKHIEQFLETLAAKANGRKIHLIAHSMGTKGLLNALRLMAYSGKTKQMFQSVILCAPDFDAGLFREQIAAEVRPLSAQWVVYASNKDIALSASEKLNTALRLGTPVTYAQGYEIIDASEIEVTPWSVPETHSYYAAKKVVLDDMIKVISGVAAGARGLKSKLVGQDQVWTFATATPGPTP